MAASSIAEQSICRLFSLADIQSATGDFSEAHVIGRGGFGKVYKAVIDGGSATVAVKRLASNSKQGEKEFAMEMETLTKVRHRNLVSLIGYCREEGEMILVYEYMANGTLADHLYKLPADLKPLSWDQYLRICIGAGRGLDYLHSGCSIIHRDVKSTNILLDESFRAKVSDFGLAKQLGGDESVSHVSASVKGSFGYFDPSYFTTGRLTRASDVYAFGVVLLEVLSGRSALDPWMSDDGYLCMSMWAQERIRNRKVDQIIAPVLRGEISDSCLKTFVGVARRCLFQEPKKRITMTQAVAQLELALEQHERRGTGASRLLFWPFRNRSEASAVHEPEPEPELEPEPEPEPELEETSFNGFVYVPKISLAELKRAKQKALGVPTYVCAFPLAEVEDAIRDFSLMYMIVEQSEGERISRAVLKSAQYVATKQFDRKLEEADILFLLQVTQLCRLEHENMVPLLGYCLDGSKRGGVFEFAPRGSLHAILHETKTTVATLSWAERIKVADGAARGLCYIHDNNMIHRDIRSSNVFLFDNEVVKITHPDVWSSCSCKKSLFGNGEPYLVLSCASSPFMIHYPECPWSRTRSSKEDVYSFGLVLLELLTGTELFGCSWEQQQKSVSWAKVRLFQGKVHEIVDATFKADYPLEPVEKMAEITKLCLHHDDYLRPDMTTVSQALQIASQETRHYYLQQSGLWSQR